MQGGGVRVVTNNNFRRENNGNEQQQHQQLMRKGPWMAEEDEILLEYVRKHGPRDWSSIRSKGLLPRTGKSCRLRWVNKLKPDLKTGCKFSPEEERIVIDLQARFGNKWARIATYLPGRTDNDVKNFWSTRQKRLARILQTPLPSNSNKNQASKVPAPTNAPTFEVACLDLIPFGDEPHGCQCNQTTSYVDDSNTPNMIQMPEMQSQVPVNSHDAMLPIFEQPLDWEPPLLHFEHLPSPALDFPLLVDNPELIPGLGDMSFQDSSSFTQLPESLPFFALGVGRNTVKTEANSGTPPDSFFNDFPADMLDYLEQPPPPPTPTSSAAW